MAVSPLVQVKDGAGPWVDTGDDGVDVTPGNVISLRLKTPGTAVKWSLEVFGTDEVTATAPVLANVNPTTHEVTSPTTVVTFTMPSGAGVHRAIVFKSVIDGGGPGLIATFGTYVLGANGFRVGAVGETREGSSAFGWAKKLNPIIRQAAGGGADALSIQQIPVDPTDPTEFQTLVYFNSGTKYIPTQLTQDMILPGFSVTMGGGGTVEVGATVTTPAFTASYVSGPATNVILTDTEATPPKNVTSTPTSFTSDGTFQKTVISASVTFTTTAFKGSIQKTSQVSYTWLPRVYYGVATPAAYTEAFIEALPTFALAAGRARTFSVNAGVGQKIYYAYPATFGDGTFFVGGFEGGFTKVASNVSVTNGFGVVLNYDVWESNNANLGSTTVQVT